MYRQEHFNFKFPPGASDLIEFNSHWRSKRGASGAFAPGGTFWGSALLEFCEKCAITNPI